MKIDQKFRNGLWLFVQEQKAVVFKNNRLLFSLLFSYCFPYFFPIVLWSENSETGYQNANFFPKRVVETLKNGHLPVKLHSSAPPSRAYSAVLLPLVLMKLNELTIICVITQILLNQPKYTYPPLPQKKLLQFNVILQWLRLYNHNCQRFIMAGRGT